jgi:hypothetical protein
MAIGQANVTGRTKKEAGKGVIDKTYKFLNLFNEKDCRLQLKINYA